MELCFHSPFLCKNIFFSTFAAARLYSKRLLHKQQKGNPKNTKNAKTSTFSEQKCLSM